MNSWIDGRAPRWRAIGVMAQAVGAAVVFALALIGPGAALARTHGLRTEIGLTQSRFRETMDSVFGPGRWRETGGYRSPAMEDRLRREGAETVPAGRISAHSMGTPDAPGAYDAVVYGMSQARAAEMLRASGSGFARVVAEGAHGPEGAHLHIEPGFVGLGSASMPVVTRERVFAVHRSNCDSIYLRVVNGRLNPQLANCSRAGG